jgi:hypothetical protein
MAKVKDTIATNVAFHDRVEQEARRQQAERSRAKREKRLHSVDTSLPAVGVMRMRKVTTGTRSPRCYSEQHTTRTGPSRNGLLMNVTARHA